MTTFWHTLRARRAALACALALLGAGCATTHPLMPTPVLYAGEKPKPLFGHIAADRQRSSLDLLFITDRMPAKDARDAIPYTTDRSRSMAFGSTTVEFGEGISWTALASESTAEKRTVALDLKLGPTKELGHYPPIPYEVVVTSSGILRAPAFVAAHEKAKQELQTEIARRLDLAPRKEVVLYVHGYNNTFEDAALTMGELCHFLGREFVCAIFSWPAGGKRGALMGYNVDRESSEFAVEHLLKAIRAIGGTPGLQTMHLLAHSRGTDILATALSELSIESYILESTISRRFKVGNVVLTAPDIDADVAPSKIYRVFSDPDIPRGKSPSPYGVVDPSPEFKVTIYVSPDDKALAAAGWLFGSIARLGRLDAKSLGPREIEKIGQSGLFDVVEVRGATDFFGHGYFVSNPQVSADLIALLRYGLKPNEPGRPLDEVAKPFWRVRTEAEPRPAK